MVFLTPLLYTEKKFTLSKLIPQLASSESQTHDQTWPPVRLKYVSCASYSSFLLSGTWFTDFSWLPLEEESWMTGITMATRGWTWPARYWLSFSEGGSWHNLFCFQCLDWISHLYNILIIWFMGSSAMVWRPSEKHLLFESHMLILYG